MNNIIVHKCNECNKIYSGYKSLWAHNKKFHNKTVIPDIQNKSVYECRNCRKEYKHQRSIYKHERTCSIVKTNSDLEVEKMKQITLDKEQTKLDKEQETEKIKQETLKLKIKLQGMKRDRKSVV